MQNSLRMYLPELHGDLNEFVYRWGYKTYRMFLELRENDFLTIKNIHFLSLKNIFKKEGIKVTDKLALNIVDDVWRDFVDNNELYPDTAPVLKRLKQLNYKLGLITDCDLEVANGIIQKHGLADFFDVKIISSIIKAYKPNLLLFKEAVKSARCNSNEGIYVGDSELDIKGAKEIGMITVIINRDEIQNQEIEITPDFRIKNLSELLNLLD